MQITINGKEYELVFGLKFIRTLDSFYKQNIEGMEFSMGLQQANMYLEMRNPDALFNVIKAALSHLGTVPSDKNIEKFLEAVYIDGKDEELFKEIEKNMEQSPFLKRQMMMMKKEKEKHLKKLTNE